MDKSRYPQASENLQGLLAQLDRVQMSSSARESAKRQLANADSVASDIAQAWASISSAASALRAGLANARLAATLRRRRARNYA